jgi:FolB domain-containing protein
MFRIRISELEVFYHVGVPDEERAQPQRLLVSVDMEVAAGGVATTDELRDTIDYFKVSEALLRFGAGRSWKLLERLTAELAEMIAKRYQPAKVTVEVKKFIIPEARYVSVSCTRSGDAPH